MSWQCPKCGEQISSQFEACWKCGTSESGVTNDQFQHADAYRPAQLERSRNFRLSHLFLIITGTCILFSLFNAILRAEFDQSTSPAWFYVNALLVGFVFLHALTWLVTHVIGWLQRRVASDQAGPERESGER